MRFIKDRWVSAQVKAAPPTAQWFAVFEDPESTLAQSEDPICANGAIWGSYFDTFEEVRPDFFDKYGVLLIRLNNTEARQ